MFIGSAAKKRQLKESKLIQNFILYTMPESRLMTNLSMILAGLRQSPTNKTYVVIDRNINTNTQHSTLILNSVLYNYKF